MKEEEKIKRLQLGLGLEREALGRDEIVDLCRFHVLIVTRAYTCSPTWINHTVGWCVRRHAHDCLTACATDEKNAGMYTAMYTGMHTGMYNAMYTGMYNVMYNVIGTIHRQLLDDDAIMASPPRHRRRPLSVVVCHPPSSSGSPSSSSVVVRRLSSVVCPRLSSSSGSSVNATGCGD